MVDRVGFCADAAWGCPGRASVGRPYGLAIPVDGHAVGTAPWPFLQSQLRPIPHHLIRVGAAVHGLHLVGLGGAAPLLRLNGGSLHGGPQYDHRRCEPESRNTRYGHPDPPSQSATYFQLWMALLCKDSGVSSVSSMRPIYGSVMLERIAFVSLGIVSLTIKPFLRNLATASAAFSTCSP